MKLKFTLNSLAVALLCALGTSAVAQTTYFENIPYQSSVPSGWTMEGKEWKVVNFSRFLFNIATSSSTNSWLFTQSLTTTSYGKLTLSFNAATRSNQGVTMNVSLGTGQSSAEMTQCLTEENPVTNGELKGSYSPPAHNFSYEVEVPAGTYYFGIHIEAEGGDGDTYFNGLACKWEAMDEPEPEVPAVTGISLSETSLEMELGVSGRLSAILEPEDAEATVEWTVEDPDVITIKIDDDTKAIEITPQAAGETTVTATVGDFSAKCTVTVLEDTEEPQHGVKVIIGETTGEVKVGEELQLTAAVTPEETEGNYSWTSSDDEIATVSETGLVKGIAEGIATITVTFTYGETEEQTSDECEVTVVPGDDDSVESILGDAVSADVFGVDGTVVMRAADAAALRTLPAGLYIINGRKYLIVR